MIRTKRSSREELIAAIRPVHQEHAAINLRIVPFFVVNGSVLRLNRVFQFVRDELKIRPPTLAPSDSMAGFDHLE